MTSHSIFKPKNLVLGIASAIAISVSGSVLADKSGKLDLNIKEQHAGTALMELAKSAGVQIMVPESIGSNVRLASLHGQFTLTSALEQLLKGTGLTYAFRADDSVVISKEKKKDKAVPDEVEEVVVTGTVLRNVAPGSNVMVFTKDDIEKRGVTTAEDIVRLIPQNFSSLNSASGFNASPDGVQVIRQGLQGQSAANLRGLGNSATLVLVNGKRQSGSAVTEGSFLNLSNIPAAAIERVEVLLEGASSIYGADAIAGVINFILRKDYQGSQTSVRYENSQTGGNAYKLTQMLGTSWDSGSLMGTISLDKTKPVLNEKLGYTTNDFTSIGGPDRRSYNIGAVTGSASISPFVLDPLAGSYVALPADFDGTDYEGIQATLFGPVTSLGDFSGDNVVPADIVRQQATSTTDSLQVYLSLKQDISDTLRLSAELNYGKNETYSLGEIPTVTAFYIPAALGGNYTPDGVVDKNSPGSVLTLGRQLNGEYEQGWIGREETFSNHTRWSGNLGLEWDLPFRDWRLSATGAYSQEETKTQQLSFDFSTEYSNLVDNGTTAPDENGIRQPLLTEDLVNLWGNGSQQSEHFLSYWRMNFPQGPVSLRTSLNALVEGSLFEAWGGESRIGFGTELSEEVMDYQRDGSQFVGNDLLDKPSREVKAVFSELNIPFVGADNALPFMQGLRLTLGARWEEYSYTEIPLTSGFVDLTTGEVVSPPTENSEFRVLSRGERQFSQATPKAALLWNVNDSLDLRFTYSESFRAPLLSQMLLQVRPESLNPSPRGDTAVAPDGNGTPEPAYIRFSGNPNLKPETAQSYAAGFDWQPEFIPGLSLSATWTKTVWDDRIITTNQFASQDVVSTGNWTRDSQGRLIVIWGPVNIAERLSETVDFNALYSLETDIGSFDFTLGGVYSGELADTLTPGGEVQEMLATQRGPGRWKANLGLGWSRDSYGANLYYYWESGYTNTTLGYSLFQDGSYEILDPIKVSSHGTVDLTGYLELPDSGWNFKAGVRNVLGIDHSPYAFTSGPYDFSRIDMRGRVMYLEVKKEFSF